MTVHWFFSIRIICPRDISHYSLFGDILSCGFISTFISLFLFSYHLYTSYGTILLSSISLHLVITSLAFFFLLWCVLKVYSSTHHVLWFSHLSSYLAVIFSIRLISFLSSIPPFYLFIVLLTPLFPLSVLHNLCAFFTFSFSFLYFLSSLHSRHLFLSHVQCCSKWFVPDSLRQNNLFESICAHSISVRETKTIRKYNQSTNTVLPYKCWFYWYKHFKQFTKNYSF